MSEEIKPCPVCKREPAIRRLAGGLFVACAACGITVLGIDNWNRLSNAAALARAVERIETLMRASGETDERQLLCDAVGERIFADIGIVPDGVVLSKVQQRAKAATFAAALIALAGEVGE